jgi:thioredoxin family protein
VERVGNATVAKRRIALLGILASATLGLVGAPAGAQKALTTPRGTGRPKLERAAQLTPAHDLALDGGTSMRERKPILLFFDRQECRYCEQALREYLVPMSREAWKERALFRQVDIDRPLPLTDFDSTITTHERLAARFGVSLSPTVLVVDGNGNVLAGPLVGLMTVDFYGAYLEDALDAALKKLAG